MKNWAHKIKTLLEILFVKNSDKNAIEQDSQKHKSSPNYLFRGLHTINQEQEKRVLETLLRSMVSKSSQNSSWMKTSCHIRGLIGEVKISYLSFKILEKKHIAGPDIPVYNSRLDLLMQIF